MKLPLDAFRPGELRPHLVMNFRLLDEHGGTLAISRNLAELRAQYGDRVTQTFAAGRGASTRRAEGELAGPDGLDLRRTAGTAGGEGRRPRRRSASPRWSMKARASRLRAFDTEDKARAMHRRGWPGCSRWR